MTLQIQATRGRVYSLQDKSIGDANVWIRACPQHTPREQRRTRLSEHLVEEIPITHPSGSFPQLNLFSRVGGAVQAELRSASHIMEDTRKLRHQKRD